MHLGKILVEVRALVAVLHFRRVSLPTVTVGIMRATVPMSPVIPPPSVPMLSLHNPFDVLGDMDFLPEEIVDELMYGAETASGEIRAAAQCSDGAAAQVPVP